jgi:hypothetical protein
MSGRGEDAEEASNGKSIMLAGPALQLRSVSLQFVQLISKSA